MYWMLLPPSANAGRHMDAPALPLGGSWGERLHVAWDVVLHLFSLSSR
jgi:hypothetical protein